MDDLAPEVPGFVGVDENCSYCVKVTKRYFKSDKWKQMGTCLVSELMASFLKRLIFSAQLLFLRIKRNTH